MGYSGQTLTIPFNTGGLNGDYNIDLIPHKDMVEPTRNINIHEGGRGKRGGTSHIDATAMSGAIMGIYDFTMRSGSQKIVRATSDGKLWSGEGAEIQDTTLALNKITTFETFLNYLYICNGASIPRVWTGSGLTTALAAPSADWAGLNQPKKMIKHGQGNSLRLWAIGTTTNPGNVYYSKLGATGVEAVFTGSGSGVIYIETGDGYGILDIQEFGDRLVCFGKTKSFIIDDTSTDVTAWGYAAAQWEGGTATMRTVVKIDNDMVSLTEDGEIYSIKVMEGGGYGDYHSASLTRPAFMHNWVKDNVDLTKFADFHGVYDPKLRCILYFITKKGYSLPNTALCYFVDRPPTDAWMIKDNLSNPSGYDALCSAVVKKGAGDYKIYTGDNSGYVWELETANMNDNGNAYNAGFKTPNINLGDPRVDRQVNLGDAIVNKFFKGIILLFQAKGDYDFYVKWWLNGGYQGNGSINMKGTGGVFPFALDSDLLGGNEILEESMELGADGMRIQFEIYNNNANEDFFLSQMVMEYKVLGKGVY